MGPSDKDPQKEVTTHVIKEDCSSIYSKSKIAFSEVMLNKQ